MQAYIGVVHKGRKSDYGVSFPDFPGCVTAGATPEEAYKMALEALPFHIEGMQEDGEVIPEPRSFEVISLDPEYKNFVMTFMVPVRLSGKAKRVNIIIDENLLNDIDNVTNNRSAFLAAAAREKLRHAE